MAAAVIIKKEERRAHEEAVLRSSGVRGNATPAQREAAEVICARSVEVVKGGKDSGKRYY